jgi:hypothetical protein
MRPRVGLHFADGPPARPPVAVQGVQTMDEPAGEPASEVRDSFRVAEDIDILSIYPHAQAAEARLARYRAGRP